MTKDKIETLIEDTETKMKRKLTQEEKDKFYVRFGNMVAKKIELRDGEVDLRELNKKDLIQLEDRNVRDLIAYDKILVGEIADLTNLVCVLMEKLGIEKPLEKAQEFELKIQQEELGIKNSKGE